jgi:uncharacterized protein YndB with AHSA1/START domain
MKSPFKVYIKVQKPVAQVFDAVYNPRKLQKYFTTKRASAPMKAGTTVFWDFADFPGEFPVKVITSIKNKRLVFEWGSAEPGRQNRVTMNFKRVKPRETKVTVSESGWTNTPKGRQSSYQNCWGWGNMIACLKAYLEYGINLRQGAF